MTASINSIAVSDANVFVAGSFQNADGQATADEVAQFTGGSWAPIGFNGAGNGPLRAAANAITLFGSRVIAGGNFTSAGGDPLAAYIASNRIFNLPPTPITVADGFHGANTALAYSLAADPDGTIASYRWNWGDGSPDSSIDRRVRLAPVRRAGQVHDHTDRDRQRWRDGVVYGLGHRAHGPDRVVHVQPDRAGRRPERHVHQPLDRP